MFALTRLGVGPGPGRPACATVATLDPRRVAELVDTIAVRRPLFVIFEGVALLDALEATRRAHPALCLVLDCHNVESLVEAGIRRSRLPAPLRFVAPLIHRQALRRCRWADRRAVQLVDAVWFCSPEDLAAARGLSPLPRAHVVANPIPSWALEAGDHVQGGGDDVLFVGHLGYRPNRRAVHELCTTILPRLRRLRPDARLHVCGRGPSAELARWVEAAGGRLTADPADLRDAYRAAAVVVAPLREGGGTRIKIIEALALGRPIVATAKAVEGLGLTPGSHYVRAETSREFVTAIARLLDSAEESRATAARGREFAVANFGPRAREAAFLEAVRSIAAPGP